MKNDGKITFRCKVGKHVLYTPEYLHDVEAMRKHPEYEEVKVADDGTVTVVEQPPESLVQRPMMFVDPAPQPAPKKATRKKA